MNRFIVSILRSSYSNCDIKVHRLINTFLLLQFWRGRLERVLHEQLNLRMKCREGHNIINLHPVLALALSRNHIVCWVFNALRS